MLVLEYVLRDVEVLEVVPKSDERQAHVEERFDILYVGVHDDDGSAVELLSWCCVWRGVFANDVSSAYTTKCLHTSSMIEAQELFLQYTTPKGTRPRREAEGNDRIACSALVDYWRVASHSNIRHGQQRMQVCMQFANPKQTIDLNTTTLTSDGNQ